MRPDLARAGLARRPVRGMERRDPPQRVRLGPVTNDEMAGLHVQSIPVHMEELQELNQSLWGAVMRSVGGSFYRLPKASEGEQPQ